MIINTELLTNKHNKIGRTNQPGKPALEAVSLAWRSNRATKLTHNPQCKVNHSGIIKTDCLIILLNLNDIWRNRAEAPRLKPETSIYGQKRLADNNAIPYPDKPYQAGLNE